MKSSRYITKRLFSLVSSSKLDYHDLLLKNLPLETKDIDNIILLHGQKLLNIPSDKIIKNCELLRKLNVQLNPITNIVTCLQLHPTILKHRTFLLEEMGVPTVDVNLIFRLPLQMKISANDFKIKSKIPMEQNIMINLLRYIDDKISDPPPLKLLNESLPLFMHFEQCFLYYSARELGINDIKLLTCRGKKYKSIRLMIQLLKIFREDIGVDQEYLKNHLRILEMCPDSAKYVLESLKDVYIGSMTIQEAVKKKPEILQYDPENIKALLKSFKYYEIGDSAVNHCLQILKIKNEDFIKKMKYWLTIPDIKVWCKNPRFLYFIVNEKVINKRIDYLRKTGLIKWTNVHLITSTNQHFIRYQHDELSYTNKRTYIKYILSKELGSDNEHTTELLTRHPYWNRVSFVDLDSTLCYLKKYFQIEDICRNIHLVLYPWTSITKTLKTIEETYAHKQDHPLTTSQLLAFCLYLLEKSNHFTGDGVWDLKAEARKSLKKEKLILEDISHRSNDMFEILNNKELHMLDKQYMRKI